MIWEAVMETAVEIKTVQIKILLTRCIEELSMHGKAEGSECIFGKRDDLISQADALLK